MVGDQRKGGQKITGTDVPIDLFQSGMWNARDIR